MPTTPIRLALLGGFTLTIDATPVPLPLQSQRVLAYVSVAASTSHGGTPRAKLADRLWPLASERRGQSTLRTALWRIRRVDPRLLSVRQEALLLGDVVDVDLRESLAQANRLLAAGSDLDPLDAAVDALQGDLLPGWDEDWLLLERERVRQLHLHALEALAHRLRARGRYAEAVDAALAAITAEPLRESAQSALISVHLAEGNVTEAYRQYDRYTALLWAELRITPSAALAAKVRAARPVGSPAG
jgi:DNA-binding SARP family transcriptional activator